MPIYEYVCNNCGYEFENFQSISSEPIKVCPKCGHESVQRKVSGGVGLIFKGSGFYCTDYTKNSSSAGSEGESDKKKAETEKSKVKKDSGVSKDTTAKKEIKV
ncbi:MAG: zinc ribbon domain-containing protein [Candidatus Neomarinimicrobiota bacterium]|nr:MAG: zinc ribbon domain-containing protein [Candidatus Neomarinimicrobiota bacterium]